MPPSWSTQSPGWMLLTDRKMTCLAMVRPASPDFWKEPRVTIFYFCITVMKIFYQQHGGLTVYTACLDKSLLLIVIHLFVCDYSVKGSAENSSELTENGNNQFKWKAFQTNSSLNLKKKLDFWVGKTDLSQTDILWEKKWKRNIACGILLKSARNWPRRASLILRWIYSVRI